MTKARPLRSVLLGAGLVLVLGAVAAGAPGDPAYKTNFSEGAPRWSPQKLVTSPDGQRFYGRLTDDRATLTLDNLPNHRNVEVEFDIYILDSMDGNDTGPGSGEEENGVASPDIFRFTANGRLIKQTTFGNRHPQAYPGDYPGASNPPKTGARDTDSLGYEEDTTFRLRLSFSHRAESLTFVARGVGIDDVDDESWGIDNVTVRTCPFKKEKTGTGYDGLTAPMKTALGRLYDALDDMNACYRFNIGARDQAYQDRLRERWHDIADKKPGDTRSNNKICKQLKAAGFAQCPTGYKPANDDGLRVAKGGPAVNSRHTLGQAADISVRFPDEPDLSKYQEAARQAGLCGPPAKDPVHVELPYTKNGRYRCWFPKGPAPD